MKSLFLPLRKVFQIRPVPPFHFNGTFRKPSHFPNHNAVDFWEPGSYWLAFRFEKNLYGVFIQDIGKCSAPCLQIALYARAKLTGKKLNKIRNEIEWRFELKKDWSTFYRSLRQDRRFAPVFRRWIGMRNMCQYSLYELLVVGLVLQNATIRRSQQMLDALMEKFGTKVRFNKKSLYAFWLPGRLQNVPEGIFRNLKLGYRAKTLKRFSQQFAKNTVDEHSLRALDTESANKDLRKLYGVGPETARILLFESLHRPNTFHHIAPWQQKIYSRLFYRKRRVSIRRIRRDILRTYGHYAMLAVHYIWEDLFWRREQKRIPWLEKEIRL